MNIMVRLVPIMLIGMITNKTYCGTVQGWDWRLDSTQFIDPIITSPQSINLDYMGYQATYSPTVSKITTSSGPTIRIEYVANNGIGVPMRKAPKCEPNGDTITYTDSNGRFDIKCNTLVQYQNGSGYQTFDPAKSGVPINKIAYDATWLKNGAGVDPSTTPLPGRLARKFLLWAYEGGISDIVNCQLQIRGGHMEQTRLEIDAESPVNATGDVATINYSWSVTTGTPYISAMYTKMYMEQLDSNLVMSYVKPDGSGAEMIVPNTKVTIDTIKGLSCNGTIKLKLDSKTGFGTGSSKLRVTVEWQ